MERLFQDLRFAIRTMLRSPGFTIVAVMALAIGIGANTAIFSVVNAVLIKPLPYKDPDNLVVVWENNRPRAKKTNVISAANFLNWQEQNSVFEQMAAFHDFRFNLTEMGEPEELAAQRVSVNLFPLLGINPMFGRAFSGEEGQPGRENVALLSFGLWQRRFGGDQGLIGKSIKLSGKDFTVIGIMPPDFQLAVKLGPNTGKKAEIWTPIPFSASDRTHKGRYMAAIARLKPGVTITQAQSEMNTIADRLEKEYPEFNTGWGVNLVPLRDQLVGEIRPALILLLCAVAFVLLIACANVANLLLSRATGRQREIAIRTALGANRWRIIRQLFTENILLSGLGGFIGLLLSLWGVELLLAVGPKDLLRLSNIGVDYRVLGFTFAVSILTALIFGLAPALETSSPNLNESLKEGKGTMGGGRSHRFRNIFVVAEISLALLLLIGSGLLIQSFIKLQSINPGFNPDNLLTVSLILPSSKYQKGPQVIGFYKQLLERIEKLPGVRSASAISFLPFNGLGAATGFTIVDRPAPAAGEKPVLDVRVIDPGYFQTMGIPLLKGRNFTEREATEPSRVVIINESLARRYFSDEDPIGKKIAIEMSDNVVPSEIIGIVGDAKYMALDTDPRPMSYWPHPELLYSFMTLVIRTESNPLSLAGAVKQEVRAIDPEQPIADINTMEQLLSDSVARARFSTVLLGIFAGMALLLAAIGIYGVMSYTVTQRTHEIGIRMALGAQSRDVLKMVIKQGMLLALIGVGIGLGAAFALTRLMSSLLYGVSATDPITFFFISLLLCSVTLFATYIPARRATKVDPMVALRYE
jgi:putative ABC transport system permease protein